ncbi:hypothetical protein GCM10023205_82550 [Yinghuangia aomiensis]|uniref:Uncharacterized protein n=1 Tax=Yinghuangia aomiensis TaxID=676205 RepID=A0ABP9IGQ1_9ACTN
MEDFESSGYPAAWVVKRLDRSIEFLGPVDCLRRGCGTVSSARSSAKCCTRSSPGSARRLDGLETAVDTGKSDMDNALTRRLRGE